jgi:hypothetical protein
MGATCPLPSGMCGARTPAGPPSRARSCRGRAAVGARRHRVAALDRRSGRRGPRRVVDHRERRGAGRGQACVDPGPTPVRRRALVQGRFKQVFKTWLGEPDTPWRDGVEVVAMDGFTGFKTATSEDLPDAVAVMDPFHVVRLAGDEHVEVEATWGLDQRMIAADREPDRKRRRELLQRLIGSISHSVPTALREVITLGRTRKRRAVDVLAYFDQPGTPTGRPRRSTAASNSSAAQPSAFATSPTTSPDRFWRPAGSDPDYTLDHEEPHRLTDLRFPVWTRPAGPRWVRASVARASARACSRRPASASSSSGNRCP